MPLVRASWHSFGGLLERAQVHKCVYIYICAYMYVCSYRYVYVHIHMCIEHERETERERVGSADVKTINTDYM